MRSSSFAAMVMVVAVMIVKASTIQLAWESVM